ncbi:MAG: cupin domain-containing protein [Fimbriimonadaceae bacterium]|nr:cupin domain-containing protein [Fimbriimonadaceae bacterium]
MEATIYNLDDVRHEQPVPKIHLRRVRGERILFAHVTLEAGCHIATHHHESEQIAYVVSGRVLWRLGDPDQPGYREVEVTGGNVVVLPSNFPHGVDAIEETHIIDLLSPPGQMGVDRQAH